MMPGRILLIIQETKNVERFDPVQQFQFCYGEIRNRKRNESSVHLDRLKIIVFFVIIALVAEKVKIFEIFIKFQFLFLTGLFPGSAGAFFIL